MKIKWKSVTKKARIKKAFANGRRHYSKHYYYYALAVYEMCSRAARTPTISCVMILFCVYRFCLLRRRCW